MKHSEMLEAAKIFLWDGKMEYSFYEKYICCAIEKAFYALMSREGSVRHLRALQSRILDHLDGNLTIENYVYDKLGREERYKLTCEDFQNLRLELLNNVIEEYESEGD